jgi:hypothetical protein
LHLPVIANLTAAYDAVQIRPVDAGEEDRTGAVEVSVEVSRDLPQL